MTAPAQEVLAALARHGVTDADASELSRALYSSDASVYRVPPLVVVRPRHVDELGAVLAAARETRVPVTLRGAGTSIAGNAVGAGIVVDTVRHLGRVRALDPEERTAVVEPGTVHATLQRAAAAHGLRFGPDPSTHSRCTVGGMVGNNACGSRALGYGRTSDNVVALEALTAAGDPVGRHAGALAAVVDRDLAAVRTRFGRFPRQVSGYALEHLLPEHGRNVDRFLVGSEGTLAVVTAVTVRLVADPPHRVLAVLGYPDVLTAADAVPTLLAHRPVACEGMDERITDLVPSKPALPAGRAWLLVEVTGATEAEAVAAARAVVRDAGVVAGRVVTDEAEQQALWRIREDGAGLASRATTPPGQPGWEDAAVPPERLGAYLRDFDALLAEHGYTGVPYGHFGEGCVHVRIDFDLPSSSGRAAYRRFVEAAARLAVAHGGSLSGEHGDGRARSELLPVMYDEVAIDLFRCVKGLLDPDDLLNPGVLVRPAPIDADVRLAGTGAPVLLTTPVVRLPSDSGDLLAAVHRCTGVGRCVADSTGPGGVMCPSYVATRREQDSTRGRARVLQEAVSGRLPGGWRSEALSEALDLCLGCKGCARDCPTGVDVATYKAEWLHQRYAGRRRPLAHYTLGRLPQLLRAVPPRLANLALSVAPGLAARAAGVDPRRSLPRPALRPVSGRAPVRLEERPDVVVWIDTFTDRFAPEVADDAAAVLRAAGQQVALLAPGDACCGLTWVSTGQLPQARARLGRLLALVDAEVPDGVPVVGLEPSCLALLRSDARELLEVVPPVVARLRTLAEHLTDLGSRGRWYPPDLTGTRVVAQPHCHHASVLGWTPDEQLLRRTGATVTRVGGCCGLAGDFGMTPDHHAVSTAVFDTALGPAVRSGRAEGDDLVVLADGFSCRTQLADLAHTRAVHLATLLAGTGSTGGREAGRRAAEHAV